MKTDGSTYIIEEAVYLKFKQNKQYLCNGTHTEAV